MQVSVGVIFNKNQQVLITKRSLQSSHPGKWEFPGGKVLESESSESALVREIKEEIGLEIVKYSLLTIINHNYLSQNISLIVYNVSQYIGNATCLESQAGLEWVYLNDLHQFEFPEANQEIIDLLISTSLELTYLSHPS